MKRSTLTIILSVAVLAGLIWFIFHGSKPLSPFETLYPVLPLNFPKSVPVEPRAYVLKNGLENVGSKTQGTLVFESAKTADQNFAIYKKYLGPAGGWKIVAESNDPQSPAKAIFAQNSRGIMTVNINSKSPSGSVVSLYFVTSR